MKLYFALGADCIVSISIPMAMDTHTQTPRESEKAMKGSSGGGGSGGGDGFNSLLKPSTSSSIIFFVLYSFSVRMQYVYWFRIWCICE